MVAGDSEFRITKKVLAVLKELWFLLPLWIFTLNAISIYDGMINCSSVSQNSLSWIVIFPLIAAISSFISRCLRNVEGKDKWENIYHLAFFLFVILILLILSTIGIAKDYNDQDLHFWFEISTCLSFLLYTIHSLKYEGFDKTVTLFGVGFIYGLILENSGVILGFFKEENFHVYIPFLPAPFFTALGWCNVFYSCRFLVLPFLAEGKEVAVYRIQKKGWEKLHTHFRFAFLLTLFALLLDLQLDPYATHHKLWVWNSILSDFFGGVPLINFTAWISAIFPFSLIFYLLELRKKLQGSLISLNLFMALPMIIFFALMGVLAGTLLLEGIDSASLKIFMESIESFFEFLS